MMQITPAERAVLQLLDDGNPIVDIARRLRLRERAIQAMLTRLIERMGVASTVEAVADAHRRGLLSIHTGVDLSGTRYSPRCPLASLAWQGSATMSVQVVTKRLESLSEARDEK
jgi:DNA-binding CsgD family transcriptional regulator